MCQCQPFAYCIHDKEGKARAGIVNSSGSGEHNAVRGTLHITGVGRIGYAPCVVTHGTQATRHNHVRFGRPDEHRGVAAPRNHTHTRVDKCAYVIEFQLSVSHSPLLTSDHIGEREGEIVANAANDHQ